MRGWMSCVIAAFVVMGTIGCSSDAGDDSSSGTSGSPQTGACAYFHQTLKRLLCQPSSTDASCNGKFFAGATCAGFSCPNGATSPTQCTVAGASSSGGSCTSSYKGPTDDAQVATQCMSVWNYLCIQKNPTAAKKNCAVYDSLEATVPCPYC